MNMNIDVQIIDGPLAAQPTLPQVEHAGAITCFDGIVRPTENNRPLHALDYEAYEPMASRMLRDLAQKLIDEFNLLAVHVQHSRGRVPVGTCSFRLIIASRHRKEGLAAADAFIDRLKQDVPIWKTPVYADAEGEER